MNAAKHIIYATLIRREHGRVQAASSLVQGVRPGGGTTPYAAATAARSEPPGDSSHTQTVGPRAAPIVCRPPRPGPAGFMALHFVPGDGFTGRPQARHPGLSLTSVSYSGGRPPFL